MFKVFAISGSAQKISTICKYLKKLGFDVEETRFKEYLIVCGKDPTDALHKAGFKGFKVVEITDEHYEKLTKKAEFFEFLNPRKNLRVGDAIIVVEGQYKGAAGIVKELFKDTVLVSLTVWGLPYNVELPYDQVRKA